MTEPRGNVAGIHKDHHVQFYGISTCIWCRKTRQYLEDNQVTFDFVYVDLLEGDEREAVKDRVRAWNPRVSFPTIVIDDQVGVIGFKPDELQEHLGL